MPFVPVPGVASTAIRATLYNKPIQTDFNFLVDAAMSSAILQELAENLQLYWQTEALPLLPNVYKLISVYAFDAGEQEGLAYDAVAEGQTTGLYQGIPQPANVSLFFNSRVSTRKRGNSGGIYWPCFVETDTVDNNVVPLIIASITTMLNGLVAPGAIQGDCRLVSVSKYLNGAERPVGVTRPVTGFVANDSVIDSMRRRLPKRNS